MTEEEQEFVDYYLSIETVNDFFSFIAYGAESVPEQWRRLYRDMQEAMVAFDAAVGTA